MEFKLQTKAQLSRKAAVEKLCAFARFGNHYQEPRPTMNREVEAFLLSEGVDTNKLIERLRDPAEHVPFFENLVGATWSVSGGSEFSVVNSSGETQATVIGPGQLSTNNCQATFETAVKARDRAIKDQNLYNIYECTAFGISSIDAFFDCVSTTWNHSNPERKLTDSRKARASIETKILEWLPIMSGGKPFDRSNRRWSDFKILKHIRDNHAIHPKGGQAMSLSNMAMNLNAFRHGIAHLLGNFHVILHCPVPAVIINAIYFPDIEVIQLKK